MSEYISPDLMTCWRSLGEETVTWSLDEGDEPAAIVWQAGGTELAITHIVTNFVTEEIQVLLTIGDDDLSLWVPLGDLIDHTPTEVTAWIIENAPLTDEERSPKDDEEDDA